MPVAAFIRRSWVSWQISFRSRTSRGRPGRQVAPVRAWPGQRWTQREQPLHWLSSTGGSQGRGASVTRLDRRTALPYARVTSRQLLPTQPSPARVATVLWGSGVDQPSSWTTAEVVWAQAR